MDTRYSELNALSVDLNNFGFILDAFRWDSTDDNSSDWARYKHPKVTHDVLIIYKNDTYAWREKLIDFFIEAGEYKVKRELNELIKI